MGAVSFADARGLLDATAVAAREEAPDTYISVEVYVATREQRERLTLYAIAHSTSMAKPLAARFLELAITLGPIEPEYRLSYWRGAWHLQLDVTRPPPRNGESYTDEWKGP